MKKLPRDHIHCYKKKKYRPTSKNSVVRPYPIYKCVHPDCMHYADSETLQGKRAICFLCNTEFTLTAYALRLSVPHCGCRSLTIEQRERVSALGKTAEDQDRIAGDIMRNLLRNNMGGI